MSTFAAAEVLDSGLADLGLGVTALQRDRLLRYLDLLCRWNQRFNLTAVRDRESMVTRHLIDSLSLLPQLPAGRIADVGAGAGLPGIPLAIAAGDCHFTLIDSNGKKTRFMFQAVAELALDNCSVVKARVESWQPDRPMDAVVSRAFASLADMVDTCAHLLAPGAPLLAMKGQPANEELATARRYATVAVTPLIVPGLGEARCVVSLWPHASAPV